MKILHISDVYGDLDMLDRAVKHAKEIDADVVVCSGDILGPCLSEDEAKQISRALVDVVRSMRPDTNGRNGNFNDAVRQIREYIRFMKGADYEPAEGFSRLEQKFDKEAERQYEQIMCKFAQFPQPVLTVPGDWDSEHYFKFFDKFDIHKKSRDVDGTVFAGYGVTHEMNPFVPQTRIIPYSEKDLFGFLSRENIQLDTDIIVTHMPPSGVQDDSRGSIVLREAMIRACPDLMLCGHAHNGLGYEKLEERIVVVNPGNLGKYRNRPEKGTFAEIEHDGVVDNAAVNHREFGDNGQVLDITYNVGAVA